MSTPERDFQSYVEMNNNSLDYFLEEAKGFYGKDVPIYERSKVEFARLVAEGVINPDSRYEYLSSKTACETFLDFACLQANIGKSAEELFSDTTIKRNLNFVATTRCGLGCLHCMYDARVQGSDIKPEMVKCIDPRFWRLFNTTVMTLDSDILEYRHNLPDLVQLLTDQGIGNMVFYVRRFRNPSARDTFQQILERTQKQGVETTARVGFDFYAPDVYNNPENPELERRFNEVLDVTLEYANETQITLVGSPKYKKSHVFRAQVRLDGIMRTRGYARLQGLPVNSTDDPLAELNELRTKHTYSDDLTDLQFMQMIGVNPFDVITQYYIDRKTGNKIQVLPGLTLNLGRWRRIDDQGEVENPLEAYWPRQDYSKMVCGVTTSKAFSLFPGGEIASCAGNLARNACIANIANGYDAFVESYQRVLNRINTVYEANLDAIMRGEFDTWVCHMTEQLPGVFSYVDPARQ